MKNLTKLFLLAVLVVFASCQNETLTEGASSIAEDELSMEDEILVSDGEEDETFVLNQDLNAEMPAPELTFSMSSNLSSEETPTCTPDIEGFELSLPETVTVNTVASPCAEGEGSFLTIDIPEGSLASVGNPGWCADLQASIGYNTYTFDVYSSYEDVSGLVNNNGDVLFENSDNFDKVNWLMNQSFIGTESPNGGSYTYGHVQWAIWELIEGAGNNCTDDCDYLSCDPIDQWDNDKANNERLGEEIVAAAVAAGEGFVPQCGQKIVVILASDSVQSLIMTTDVPEKEIPCSDCEGKVTKLELEFDWRCAKKIDIVQKYENTCYGKRVYCNRNVQPGEIINISGKNSDGTFGKYIYIYINNCYYTKIKTNCDVKIGPGYTKGVFNVISGESSHGGELCEYVKPDYNKCYRHWSCKYHNSCRYTSGGH